MPVDPQCQAILDAVATAGAPFDADDYRAARAAYTATTAANRHATPTLDSVANLMFAGPACNLPARVYRPRNPDGAALPLLVYLHGGGWVVGDLDTHDHLCRYIAGHAGIIVAAIDYRLAPEHPFPAAFDDACGAVRWAHRRADELGVDPTRIAIGGDSAGGNLAAAAALALRGEIDLVTQILFYPAVDMLADNESLRTNASGYLLTTAAMHRFVEWYVPEPDLRGDWRASPQRADDHAGLPPTLVISAEFDPLRDEARDYAATLGAAGVEVDYQQFDGMLHGFARMGGIVDRGIVALDAAVSMLNRHTAS